MRPPRFRLRTLMIVIVVIAVTMAAKRAIDHRDFCSDMAAMHGEFERSYIENPDPPSFQCGTYMASLTPAERDRYDAEWRAGAAERRATSLRWATFHSRARRIYERAAWRPWQPEPADPPEPE